MIGRWTVEQIVLAVVIEHGQVVADAVVSVQEMTVEVATAAELKAGGGTAAELKAGDGTVLEHSASKQQVAAVDISNGAEIVFVSVVAEVVLLAAGLLESLLAEYSGTKLVLLNYSQNFGIPLTYLSCQSSVHQL